MTYHVILCLPAGVTKYVNTSVAGFCMQKELDYLGERSRHLPASFSLPFPASCCCCGGCPVCQLLLLSFMRPASAHTARAAP